MIRIGDTEVRGLTAKYDGGILTLTGMNLGITLLKLSELLSGDPIITVTKGVTTIAVYAGIQLRAIQMETVGGVLAVTATMTAKPADAGGDNSGDLQAELNEVREMVQEAMDAVAAIEEGIANA